MSANPFVCGIIGPVVPVLLPEDFNAAILSAGVEQNE
jgi:hypothetical protein